MPNINLANASFANIPPGITIANQVATLTQNAANACGAYALVAAVEAFPTFPRNAQITYLGQNPLTISSAITVINTFPQIASAVYALSGILNPPPVPPELIPVAPPNIYPINGYNSLAVLAAAAIALGRNTIIYATLAGFAALGGFYPGEQARCIAVVGGGNVQIGTAIAPVNYQQPAPTQTQVIVVANVGGGLHFIARGSDGGYYDPGNGSLGNMWGNPDLQGFQAATGGNYNFGGVWMTIN